MSSKRLEELLSILESSEDLVEKLPTDIELFIRDKELVPSNEKIRTGYIYWNYLKWKEQGNGTEEIYTRNAFFKSFSKFFKTGRKARYRYYNVSGEHLGVSRLEHLELLKDLELERQQQKWQKQKNAKKSET